MLVQKYAPFLNHCYHCIWLQYYSYPVNNAGCLAYWYTCMSFCITAISVTNLHSFDQTFTVYINSNTTCNRMHSFLLWSLFPVELFYPVITAVKTNSYYEPHWSTAETICSGLQMTYRVFSNKVTTSLQQTQLAQSFISISKYTKLTVICITKSPDSLNAWV